MPCPRPGCPSGDAGGHGGPVGCITLLALWCQPNALRTVVDIFRAQPLLIVLNALPIGLLVVTFTCLFRNVFFGAALVNFCVCVLSIANRIKLEVRTSRCFHGILPF